MPELLHPDATQVACANDVVLDERGALLLVRAALEAADAGAELPSDLITQVPASPPRAR